jgi:hypothetical protein
MQSVTQCCYAKCHFTECHYIECHNTIIHSVKIHSVKIQSVVMQGVILQAVIILSVITLNAFYTESRGILVLVFEQTRIGEPFFVPQELSNTLEACTIKLFTVVISSVTW